MRLSGFSAGGAVSSSRRGWVLAVLCVTLVSGCFDASRDNPRMTPLPPTPTTTTAGNGSGGGSGGSGGGSTILTGLTQFGTGGLHTCAIRAANSSLWCWGSGSQGQLSTEDTLDSGAPAQVRGADQTWLSVASGGSEFSCGLRADHTLFCWGDNSRLQLTGTIDTTLTPPRISPERLTVYTHIGTELWAVLGLGGAHTCGIQIGSASETTGSLWCWGDNSRGQLGNGSSGSTPVGTMTRIGADSDWGQLSAGAEHTCGIRTGNALYCWGDNTYGQIGDGNASATPVTVPTQIAGGWSAVAAGGRHTCGIKTDGTLWCWGRNDYGQLGLGTVTLQDSPQAVAPGVTDWVGVAAGALHTCARRGDASLWCWGDNEAGQLGVGSTLHKSAPVKVTRSDGGAGWKSVSLGGYHTCAVDVDNNGHCWGLNTSGQLGIGTLVIRDVPRQYNTTTIWSRVDSGRRHACAIRADGTLWCGGANNEGQLGDGSVANRSTAALVPSSSLWLAVSLGDNHSCGIKIGSATDTRGTLWCWGSNRYRQLAQTDTANVSAHWSPKPVTIASQANSDWVALSAGARNTCGIREVVVGSGSGTLWCWGANEQGQLGDGSVSATPSAAPVQEALGFPDWFGVTVGDGHVCAARRPVAGQAVVYCWGDNAYGQLGNKNLALGADSATPIEVLDGAGNSIIDWISLSAGAQFTCGIRQRTFARELYCWGSNANNQLGTGANLLSPNNDTSLSNHPAAVASTRTDWDRVAAGIRHACATTSSGTTRELYCWGDNAQDQLGLGSAAAQAAGSPTRVGIDVDWLLLAPGYQHTCGIRESAQDSRRGSLWCWGANASMYLGDGSAWKESPQTLPLN